LKADDKKKNEQPKEAMPVETDLVSRLTKQLQEMLEGFQKDCKIDAHLTAKEHRRLHGAGMKSLGFITKTFEIANDNPNFAPHYLDVTLLNGKMRNLKNIMALKDVLAQFAAVVETAYLINSNDCYHDALEYYDSLKEAMNMKVDAAETPFKILQPFFKSRGKKLSPGESS
jgi:hypothetical protein